MVNKYARNKYLEEAIIDLIPSSAQALINGGHDKWNDETADTGTT